MNLSKKNKLIILVIVIGLGVGLSAYNYIMKPPTTIEAKKVDFKGNADTFITMVQENASAWLDKVVILEGVITSKDDSGITINNQIYCQFKDRLKIGSAQQKLKIKGRFIGYDDLLEEIKLDQCIIQD